MPTSQPAEPLGRRIAGFRTRLGRTQQDVASRLALSRNAVSYIETGGSIPGERTIVLLAGLFGMEPYELVAGTDYPEAKTDRLPLVAARFTQVAARLATLDAELRWVAQLDHDARSAAIATIDSELRILERRALDPAEQEQVREARTSLRVTAAADHGGAATA